MTEIPAIFQARDKVMRAGNALWNAETCQGNHRQQLVDETIQHLRAALALLEPEKPKE